MVQAFQNHNIVPWQIRNKWKNAIQLTKCMAFIVGHIYREGNTRAIG